METPPRIAMELVEVIATQHFSDSQVGGVSRKQRLKIPAQSAHRLHGLGLVRYSNPQQALAPNPQLTGQLDGTGSEPSALLPADQALTSEIATLSAEPTGEASQSTTAGDSQDLPSTSTPATTRGGKSTSKK